jgi:aryl-phospho-beta-D-glucosidase BglC (GH1 family)
MEKISRRSFVQSVGVFAAGAAAGLGLGVRAAGNPLPRWRGFNLLDYFTPEPPSRPGTETTDDDFRWMRDWGFDFVRLPMAYPRYVRFDRTRPITPDEVVQVDEAAVDRIAGLVERANRFGLHVSLNLHRAPGYCVNAGFQEPFDLWRDESALEAFCFHWKMWAERLRQVPADLVSFDLVNEPSVREDMNDQHGRRAPVPGSVYRKVAKAAAEAIWAVTPERLVVADGNDVGSAVIPEIADLRIAQSCRGYFPHYISHYRAPWVFRNPDDAPMPVWPGTMGGRHFSRADLEEFYRPWRALVRDGVGVHCGECGCWRETPHAVFLAWFGDVLDILTEAGIGYALWNFRGDFGLIDSRRKDVAYEEWHGHQLDRKLLELLRRH